MAKHKKEHIGFEGLVHNATKFYQAKGYSHEEANEIARKIAGLQNTRYVHHQGHREKRR